MDSSTRPSYPTRCEQCDKPMDSPIACSSCGALTELPADAFNCFELFGVAPGFDIDLDALHRKYLQLSRLIHPDLTGAADEPDRRRSLMLSARFNQAYEVLRHPVNRAEYLLRLAGGANCCEDKSVPEDLLGRILTLREQIDEAREEGRTEVLAELGSQTRASRAAAMDRIAHLARVLAGGDSQPETCRELRQQLNAVKYWDSLLEQISAARPDDPTQ